jgi:hypothetical protein
MTFLATASGLMMDSVRSIAMMRFLCFILKMELQNFVFKAGLHLSKPAILTRPRGFPIGEKDL